MTHPQFYDILYLPFGIAIAMLLIRNLFEWTLARPLGRYFGCKSNSGRRSAGAAAKSRVRGPPTSVLDKFCECCWRFTFYFCSFTYGLKMLWTKDWFWDTGRCWLGFPDHSVDRDQWWFYQLEISFYWSLVISSVSDVRRKDFVMHLVHHAVTIGLMWCSWANNSIRFGCLVLVLHDCADFWLEGAKMAKYAKFEKLCDILFAVFSVFWFSTRCGIYPIWILYSSLVETLALTNWHYIRNYYIPMNFMMLALFALNVTWSVMIGRMVVNSILSGVSEDERSDDEDDTDENEQQTKKSNGKA